jgi:hypothetical protein
MNLILTLIAIILILFFLFKKNSNKNRNDNLNSSESQHYYADGKCIGLSARKGYTKMPIVGMHYANVSLYEIGRFNGYAIAQTSNEYDPYAIAIFNDNGKRIGYTPAGQNELHDYIIEEGGKVHAYGYLACNKNYHYKFYAEACIESNKNLVTVRNKPYKIL